MESVPCETKNELHKRERYHIEKNVCVNKVVPLRTKHESKFNYLFKLEFSETRKYFQL